MTLDGVEAAAEQFGLTTNAARVRARRIRLKMSEMLGGTEK
jgi:DNA-directed RNA polymerase specialized sigma24 family protein